MMRTRRVAGRSGQAMVEFALCLVVLVLLVSGLVSFRRGYSLAGVVMNAAREGARYGATAPTDTTTIQSRVTQEATLSGVTITTSNITISTPNGTTSDNPITVTVTYQYQPMGAVTMLGLGSNITITRHCTMVIF